MSAELPGVSREDLDIDVKDNRLTIKGEKKLENKTEKEGYLRVERSYGAFERSFFLDDNIDRENIKAEYKDGVLRLTLPRKQDESFKENRSELTKKGGTPKRRSPFACFR